MSANYKAKLIHSTRELTGKEKVMMKNFADAFQLDEVTKEAPVIVDVDCVATIAVHNEKADNPDYNKYVFLDKNGSMYVTGSENAYRAYEDLSEDMEDSAEDWSIKFIRKESKNYKGKDFITCVIV